MYFPSAQRYDNAGFYRRCGNSGLLLPLISLGFWQNFGGIDSFENARAMMRTAFDLGITHFDLANNYGPPGGSAEESLGRALKLDFGGYRDELIISTKAGHGMWSGPYGNFGSRKYLLASLDQSLRRMGLDYVDIYYHHRPDPETPLEETAAALAHAVRSGKALYVGISNYPGELTSQMAALLRELGAPCLLHQPAYNMFQRDPERAVFPVLLKEGIGSIVFSPLAQGLLTNRYLSGIPGDSRAAREIVLRRNDVTKEKLAKVEALNAMARERGQELAQMAIAWVLQQKAVTSVLIGASRPAQIEQNVAALKNVEFSTEELCRIEKILAS